MTDVRALMAQERQARRINHEFASYTKSGVLMCIACQLNIKSETLWDGHLRSANHKANVKKTHQASRSIAKRKIEDVDEVRVDDNTDVRKKLKPKSPALSEHIASPLQTTVGNDTHNERPPEQEAGQKVVANEIKTTQQVQPVESAEIINDVRAADTAATSKEAINEDEWAAFERDIAPLAQPDYSAATITAAPVSAAQLQAEAESDRKRLRDTEAEDEKEDEERRMEEEFEVMEQMEERVRKLKEKREALRLSSKMKVDTGQHRDEASLEDVTLSQDQVNDGDDYNDSDDIDDWYS